MPVHAARRGRRRLAVALAVLVAVAIAGCGGGGEGGADRGWRPSSAPFVADGAAGAVLWPAVNPGNRPVGDVRRVADADADLPVDHAGSGLVLGFGGSDPLDDLTVVVRPAPLADRARPSGGGGDEVQLADGRSARRVRAGDAVATCGRGLALDAPSGDGVIEVLTIDGGDRALAAAAEVAATADLDADGRPMVTGLSPSWREVGRLVPGWADRLSASQLRYRLVSGTTVTAVPTTDAEQRVLAAQICPSPARTFPAEGSVADPDHEWVGDLSGQTPGRWVIRGRTAVTGQLDAHTRVLLVPGQPGLTLMSRFDGDPQLTDADLITYADGLALLPDADFDARAEAVAESQRAVAGEVVRRELVAAGYEPLGAEERDGLAWMLSLAPAAPGARRGRALCLTPVASPDGTAVLGHERHPVPDPACAGLSDPPPAGQLTVVDPSDPERVWWGLAGPGVASVALLARDGTTSEVDTPVLPAPSRSGVAKMFVLEAPASGRGEKGLSAGPGVFIARGPDGDELSRVDRSRP